MRVENQTRQSTAIRVRIMPSLGIVACTTTRPRRLSPTDGQANFYVNNCGDLPKPLAGYVFSRNQWAIDRVLQAVAFGGGAVNQTNIFLFIETMLYGGVGTSGIANYYGKYGYDSLTHAKSVLISPPDVAIDHLFPHYTKEKVQALSQWSDY